MVAVVAAVAVVVQVIREEEEERMAAVTTVTTIPPFVLLLLLLLLLLSEGLSPSMATNRKLQRDVPPPQHPTRGIQGSPLSTAWSCQKGCIVPDIQCWTFYGA